MIKKVRNVLKMEFWRKLGDLQFPPKLHFEDIPDLLDHPDAVNNKKFMLPVHCPDPEDSKKVSYVRLGWQKKPSRHLISSKTPF